MPEKLETLYKKLKSYKKLATALSGGLDSSFLFAEAVKTLGPKNVLGIHIISPIGFSLETERVKRLASALKAKLVTANFSELEIDDFSENPRNRCYICKKARFELAKMQATKSGFVFVADGTNADDDPAERPGMKAAEEIGIIHPLKDVGLTKDEIRELAKLFGYGFWNAAPQSCAMTRFPHGFRVDANLIERVTSTEDKIRSLGFWLVRLRYDGSRIKIETTEDEIAKAEGLKALITKIIGETLDGSIMEITIGSYKLESRR